MLCATAISGLASAQQGSGERKSLEELLRVMRARAAERAAELEEPLQAAMAAVESLGDDDLDRALRQQRKELVEKGPALAPLLVPYLEPGDESKGGKLRRASLAADVLIELASPAVTDALLKAAASGTTTNRLMALKVLGQSPEPERVAHEIHKLYRLSSGYLERACLECLALLGGDEAKRLLNLALNDEDLELVKAALDALASTQSRNALPQVMALVASPRGSDLVEPALTYLSSVPDALAEDEHVLTLSKLASRPEVSYQNRIRIMDHLRVYEDLKINRSARKIIEAIAEDARTEVVEAALSMLARHKDRRARNRLLAPYDDRVDRQPNWGSSYAERGDIYERIGDWNAAVGDYREALRRENNTRKLGKTYEGISRCLARLKKYREAAEYIRESPLSFAERRALASNPAFKKMLETKYAGAFRLDD